MKQNKTRDKEEKESAKEWIITRKTGKRHMEEDVLVDDNDGRALL